MLGPAKPRRLDEPIAVSLEDLVPAGPLLPPPGGEARPRLRPRLGAGALRRAGPAQHRPGRLLQAAAGHVLRGHPLRAPAHRDGQPQPGPPLVPRLRPGRGAARPLQPDPHPAAARASTSSSASSSRSSICARRPGWSGAGSSTSTPPRSRPTPTSIPWSPASTTRPRPTSPTCSRTSSPMDEADARAGRRRPACRHRPAADRAPTSAARRSTIRRGGCWRSGGWTRTGRRSAATGARPTSGSARPIPMPRRCGPGPARPWATTTTTSSTAASGASSSPRW